MRNQDVCTLIVGYGEIGNVIVDQIREKLSDSEKMYIAAVPVNESLDDLLIYMLYGYVADRKGYNPLEPLDKEILTLLKYGNTLDSSRLNIYIVGTVTTEQRLEFALQIPGYIEGKLKNNEQDLKIRFCGLFVTSYEEEDPAIYRYSRPSGWRYQNSSVYGYFQDRPVDYREYLPVNDAAFPYDSILFERIPDDRRPDGSFVYLSDIIKNVIEIFYLALFIPANEEDYHILNTTPVRSENEKCKIYSAGISILDYPYTNIREYIYARSFDKIVNKTWLLPDHLSDMMLKDALKESEENPSVKVPSLAERYVSMFEQERIYGDNKRKAIYDDAFIIDEDYGAIRKSKIYLDSIDEEVYSILDDDKLKADRELCTVSEKFDRADLYHCISAAGYNFENYRSSIKRFVKSHKYNIANRAFPESTDSLILHKEDPVNVYNLLADKHPVTARYLCYVIIDEISQRLEELQSRRVKINNIGRNFEKKTAALHQKVIDTESRKILFVIPTGKRILRGVYEELRFALYKSLSNTTDYAYYEILCTTYSVLLKRFKMLAKNYERLFSHLEKEAERNKEKINNLETDHNDGKLGVRYIYSSPDALKQSYNESSGELTFSAFDNKVKESTLLELLRSAELELDFASIDDAISAESRERIEEMIDSHMDFIIDNIIIRSLKDDIDVEAGSLYSVSIKDAIRKQMRLEGYSDSSDLFENERLKYENEMIDSALAGTASLIYELAGTTASEKFYIALHPDAGEEINGKFDLSQTLSGLSHSSVERNPNNTTIIVDNSFSDKRIMCMKVVKME